MILTKNELEQLAKATNIISGEHQQTIYFSEGQSTSLFLSHKHDEIKQLKRVAYLGSLHDTLINFFKILRY